MRISRLNCRVGRVAAFALGIGGLMSAAPAQFVALNIAGNPAGDALVEPVGVYSAPGDYSRIFVLQKTGQIRTIDISQPSPVTQPSATPFLNLGSLVQTPSNLNDERGLLGLAFHPQYQTNGKLYIYYTNPTVSGMPTGFNYFQNIVEYTVRDPVTHAITPNASARWTRLPRAWSCASRTRPRAPPPTTTADGSASGPTATSTSKPAMAATAATSAPATTPPLATPKTRGAPSARSCAST